MNPKKHIFVSSSEESSLVDVQAISGKKHDSLELNRMKSVPRESTENVFTRPHDPESPPPGEYSDIFTEQRPASIVQPATYMSTARVQPTEYKRRYSSLRRPAAIAHTTAAWSEAKRSHNEDQLTDDHVQSQDETDARILQVQPVGDVKEDEVHELIALDEFQKQQQQLEEEQIEKEVSVLFNIVVFICV